MDLVNLLFNGAGLVVLGGIFYRLGRFGEAIEGLGLRVGNLEEWRKGFPLIRT